MKESTNIKSGEKMDSSWMWVKGNWNGFKGEFKEKFGKFTDDDMMVIDGKRDQAIGLFQKRYSVAKDKAEELLSDWEKNCKFCKTHKNSDKAMDQRSMGDKPMGSSKR